VRVLGEWLSLLLSSDEFPSPTLILPLPKGGGGLRRGRKNIRLILKKKLFPVTF